MIENTHLERGKEMKEIAVNGGRRKIKRAENSVHMAGILSSYCASERRCNGLFLPEALQYKSVCSVVCL